MSGKFFVLVAALMVATVMVVVAPAEWSAKTVAAQTIPPRPTLPLQEEDAHSMRVKLNGVEPGQIRIWRLGEDCKWIPSMPFNGHGWDPTGWAKLSLQPGLYAFAQAESLPAHGPAIVTNDETREQEFDFELLPPIDLNAPACIEKVSPPAPPALPAPTPVTMEVVWTGNPVTTTTVVFTITIEIQPYNP